MSVGSDSVPYVRRRTPAALRLSSSKGFDFGDWSGTTDLAVAGRGVARTLFRVPEHETLVSVKGVDIIVLLDLAERDPAAWTMRAVAADLGLPLVTVKRSVDRLADTPVLDTASRRVNRSEVEHLLVDALRFMFPAHLGAQTRGVPTAWAASPLKNELSGGGDVPVWPSPTGEVRGAAVEPLHEAAVGLAATNPRLYEQLTLVDGLRLGDARARGVAAEMLRAKLAVDARTRYASPPGAGKPGMERSQVALPSVQEPLVSSAPKQNRCTPVLHATPSQRPRPQGHDPA